MYTKVKKICTIGPATNTEDKIEALIHRGMNVARLNFSHDTHETHGKVIDTIKKVRKRLGVNLGILQDLSGPKMRLGIIKHGPVEIMKGDTIKLFPGKESSESAPGEFAVDYPPLLDDGNTDNRILIDDGLVILRVKKKDKKALTCIVEHGGAISSKKGVNFPDQVLSSKAPTEKDLTDLRFGLKTGVDMVALSFVQTPEDILILRREMERCGRIVPIIAKIERTTAIQKFSAILDAADAIMVARGDLGIEAEISMIPIYQKQLIRECNIAGKPVITATQMLDSMIRNPTPTRAEVTDVANAIFDSTDAIMLSGETAMGKFPEQAIELMTQIAGQVEENPQFNTHWTMEASSIHEDSEHAIARATVETAQSVGAKFIIAPTLTGQTAKLVAKSRPRTPLLAVTPSEATYYQLSLLWGVQALLLSGIEEAFYDTILKVEKALLEKKMVVPGDFIVITAGMPAHTPGGTNTIKVHKIRDLSEE